MPVAARKTSRCSLPFRPIPSLHVRGQEFRVRVPRRPEMRVSEALDRYVVQLEADGRSPHTVKQAQRHVRLLITTMGDVDVATVKPEDVARFLASDAVAKTEDGRARRPSSANAMRSSVRTFFG